jgi:hypothetical protein
MMRLPENVRSLTNSDGGVILDLRKGKIFRLNPTGAAILELLIRGYEKDRVTAEISKRCGIDSTLVAEDLQSFLKSLESNELLHRED